MIEFICKEALDRGFVFAIGPNGNSVRIDSLDPDKVGHRNFYLQSEDFFRGPLTPSDFTEQGDLCDNLLEHLATNCPSEVWDKALEPLNLWLNGNPLPLKTTIGVLINRRL